MAIPKQPAFEEAEYERRLEQVQRAMAQRRLDAMVLFSPHNIFYLSGMDSENLFDYQCLVVPAAGEPTLVIFDFERARCENSCPLRQVETYTSFEDPVKTTLAAVPTRTGRVALEQQSSALSAGRFQQITEGLGQAEILDAFGVVEPVRLIKSAAEVAYMRKAAKLTEAGVAAGVAAMAPGKPDYEIAAAITEAMYRGGRERPFAGVPSSRPDTEPGALTARSTGTGIETGDTIFLEVTGAARRYTGPLMRTAILGEARGGDPQGGVDCGADGGSDLGGSASGSQGERRGEGRVEERRAFAGHDGLSLQLRVPGWASGILRAGLSIWATSSGRIMTVRWKQAWFSICPCRSANTVSMASI